MQSFPSAFFFFFKKSKGNYVSWSPDKHTVVRSYIFRERMTLNGSRKQCFVLSSQFTNASKVLKTSSTRQLISLAEKLHCFYHLPGFTLSLTHCWRADSYALGSLRQSPLKHQEHSGMNPRVSVQGFQARGQLLRPLNHRLSTYACASTHTHTHTYTHTHHRPQSKQIHSQPMSPQPALVLTLLPNTSPCSQCTVRSNKPKRQSLEERKISCQAKQEQQLIL